MRCCFFILLVLATANVQTAAAELWPADRLLGMLPAETESVIVTGPIAPRIAPKTQPGTVVETSEQGTFVVGADGTRTPWQPDPENFLELAFEVNTGLFLEEPRLERLVRRLKITASVWAAGHFQLQDSIPAVTAYEGCQILAYDRAATPQVRAAFENGHLIRGVRVLQVATNEPWHDGKLTMLYAAPVEGLLIAATSRRYLDSVIAAAQGPRPTKPAFEIPAGLDGGDALFWGVRRDPPMGADKPAAAPQATRYLAWTYDRARDAVTVRYRSQREDAEAVFKAAWEYFNGNPRDIRRVDPQTLCAELGKDRDLGERWLIVLFLTGHAVML